MKPLTQYSDINNTGLDMIVFRYAEILLSKAEAMIEKNTDLSDATDLIDLIRERAGMPKVDRAKYNTQAKLRELLRRERRVEFAFEGLRRDDIIRWDIAKDVLNGPIYASNQGHRRYGPQAFHKKSVLQFSKVKRTRWYSKSVNSGTVTCRFHKLNWIRTRT